MKAGWILIAGGAGAGVVLALVSEQILRLPLNGRSVPELRKDNQQVAAWLDSSLLALAASSAADQSLGDTVQTDAGVEVPGLTQQRTHLYSVLSEELGVEPGPVDAIARIIERSPYAGTGNPVCTVHPMTRAECRLRRANAQLPPSDAALCGAPNMVAVFNPRTEDVNHARICMDQYEFPNVPCEYPLVWIRSSEAHQICRLLGKRLCDAHEWEGACAGALLPVKDDYYFAYKRDDATALHNERRVRTWLGSLTPLIGVCGTQSMKSQDCWDVTWEACGSNTYPTGAFPDCTSPFGVFDMLGNVAEHMNLPLTPEQLASRGGLGETEMKGSWFAYDGLAPHPDDCRWRAPSWHVTAIDAENSHRNYHLGFRCCKDI